ncbi:hypothetical protein QQS21_010415 [Conoideocrella luteorostrata]|uniref:Uncharacterized protein n=1 Tax=Conoideocrella luteorostrata TaxID=1105319 RepID=A0AAJ0CJI5_9HYPO|nr:hypothetical protein QQS21_010415 [Conoideocrella luteorostrata]
MDSAISARIIDIPIDYLRDAVMGPAGHSGVGRWSPPYFSFRHYYDGNTPAIPCPNNAFTDTIPCSSHTGAQVDSKLSTGRPSHRYTFARGHLKWPGMVQRRPLVDFGETMMQENCGMAPLALISAANQPSMHTPAHDVSRLHNLQFLRNAAREPGVAA